MNLQRVGQLGAEVSRLSSLSHDLVLGGSDIALSLTRNPAWQVATRGRDNDAYAWTGHADVDRAYAANGLNQYTAAGPATFTHDGNGNLTSDGTNIYIYDVENRLVVGDTGFTATLRYDPLGRLYEVSGASGFTRFLYDPGSASGAGSDALVAEYDGAGALHGRFQSPARRGLQRQCTHCADTLPV